jgi:hypothetical protein
MLHAFLNRISGFTKHGSPYIRVYRYQRGHEANFTLGRFGRRFRPPGHKLQGSGPDAVPQRVQSTERVYDS